MTYRFFKLLMGFPLIIGGLIACEVIESIPPYEEPYLTNVSPPIQPPSNLTEPSFLEAIEELTHQKINKHRRSLGLSSLKLNRQISQQARIHSEKMASGVVPVSHDGLETRLNIIRISVPYQKAGESLTVHSNENEPVKTALKAWLNNPSDRKNIEGDFDTIGIGVAKNEEGKYYFTQILIKENPSLITQQPNLDSAKDPLPWANRDILLERAKGSQLGQNSLTSLEQKIHQRVNEYRRSKNLPVLKMNNQISYVARLHSQDMANKTAEFSHDGFDQRAKSIGVTIPYKSVAENLAYLKGYPDLVSTAVQGWINSPGHRKAMEGNFDLTGVGIAKNAEGEYYFTQLFVLER
ncbi:MAG TPA: CAP domain-containing protein [Cyanothece sp. UBA12306]|nr:CAP domain-containing protein [Cyanothece sp. UBA12306]